MIFHLLKDWINGSKLIILATREGHVTHRRVRYFVGGLVLNLVTVFTLFVTVIYNFAIATSDTELLINAVIILFIDSMDEYLFAILTSINNDWVQGIVKRCGRESLEDRLEAKIKNLGNDLTTMRKRMNRMQEKMEENGLSLSDDEDSVKQGNGYGRPMGRVTWRETVESMAALGAAAAPPMSESEDDESSTSIHSVKVTFTENNAADTGDGNGSVLRRSIVSGHWSQGGGPESSSSAEEPTTFWSNFVTG